MVLEHSYLDGFEIGCHSEVNMMNEQMSLVKVVVLVDGALKRVVTRGEVVHFGSVLFIESISSYLCRFILNRNLARKLLQNTTVHTPPQACTLITTGFLQGSCECVFFGSMMNDLIDILHRASISDP